jgi:3-oxoacyl-[acyl-carrier-protein] synthase II
MGNLFFGIGCLSPNGLGKVAYFDAILRGKSGLRRIEHFPTDSLACQIAGELQGFDSLQWVSGKDVPHVARTVPFAIATSSQALEDAGLLPDSLSLEERRRFGVIIGSGGGPAEFAERLYRHYFEDNLRKASVYAVPSNTMGTLSSEVSMRFSLKGLSHVVSTGCTSSTDALGYAYLQVQTGRLQRVLCGGVDAPITPGIMAGFCLMKVVSTAWNHSPEQASRPFSRDRSGFILGEGAWMFMVEDLELARSRGARIYAEIKGYGATCDAYHRVRLDETGEEPARAIALALEEADIPPDAVDYINLHGTSTQLNDRIETRAIKLVMGKHAYRIATSSTKSMIGHPQGASGAAGITAALCAMDNDRLPPTINLEQPDPECDLDYVADVGRRQVVEWALCNCIGFGSKNSAVVLQRYEGPS